MMAGSRETEKSDERRRSDTSPAAASHVSEPDDNAADKDVAAEALARPAPSFLFCDGMQPRGGVKTSGYFGLSRSDSEKL